MPIAREGIVRAVTSKRGWPGLLLTAPLGLLCGLRRREQCWEGALCQGMAGPHDSLACLSEAVGPRATAPAACRPVSMSHNTALLVTGD